MATCLHTPPPCRPRGGIVDDITWFADVDQRRNLIGLLSSKGAHDAPHVGASLWLSPDDAEKVGQALLAAVAAWRLAQ